MRSGAGSVAAGQQVNFNKLGTVFFLHSSYCNQQFIVPAVLFINKGKSGLH